MILSNGEYQKGEIRTAAAAFFAAASNSFFNKVTACPRLAWYLVVNEGLAALQASSRNYIDNNCKHR
jgi:hypothetical protein